MMKTEQVRSSSSGDESGAASRLRGKNGLEKRVDSRGVCISQSAFISLQV